MFTTAMANEILKSPVRTIDAVVEWYDGEKIVYFRPSDRLISFDIERVGEEDRFFGFGVCQKVNVKLIDVNRELAIKAGDRFQISFEPDDGSYHFPKFYVTEVHRDENTNELSITAYDSIYEMSRHTISELGLESYTIAEFVAKCSTLMDEVESVVYINIPEDEAVLDLYYEKGANFEGTELIRDALNAVAEITQTVYYIDYQNRLIFKRMDKDGAAVLTIDKSMYFTLHNDSNRRLAAIAHITDLGDNVITSYAITGTTQYLRNNPFLDLREEIGTLLEEAIERMRGFTLNQFDCAWRGNYGLEIGDKINLVTKDDDIETSYVINDTISYDGSLTENTKWKYTGCDTETASNPANLGETLKETYAKVDKINKEITLVASDIQANKEAIGSLQINTDSISASVEYVEKTTSEAIEEINDQIIKLSKKVETNITAEDLQITVEKAIENGVTSVTTSTGFTFNEEGLTISKSDSEISTQITEDGMQIFKNNEDPALLTVNNEGVSAANLHAVTYLIIGTNSRFEDYEDSRTGCFYIGEVND